MSQAVKTAVVILNWNGKKYLEQFLPPLVKYSQGDDIQIVVADNGSKDDSVSFLKKSYPDIKLLEFDKNYGFTGGYNKALFQLEAEYFVLLNSDIEVTENWLVAPVRLLDSDTKIGAVAPKIKSRHNKNMFEYAGAAGGYIDKFGYPFCRGRILSEIEEDKGQYNRQAEIFWASGAAMFIRADLYKKAGGLDEDFFAHMEEIDLCWRLQNMNYKIVYCPDSEVFHVGGGTLSNDSPHKLFLNYRNNLFLLYKNLPEGKLFLTIFMRLILDGISAMLYLVQLKFSYFAAVWKAHFAFYGNLKSLRAKRKQLINHNKPLNTIYQKSIIFNYYIKKRKIYSDLT